jgi:diketogulonate reductase-like aldo/keto reductase
MIAMEQYWSFRSKEVVLGVSREGEFLSGVVEVHAPEFMVKLTRLPYS